MSTRVRDLLMNELGALRHEPTPKRIRAMVGDKTVVDSRSALLIWEPKRIVPSYAVPVADVAADLVEVPAATENPELPRLGDRPVMDPSVPFAAHTTDGRAVYVQTNGRAAAGFLPDDPDLAGHVILDFNSFDAWYEEEEQTFAHPRDPFHRIDILRSTRHVRIELDGQVLAETDRPYLLFETNLPTRSYMPEADVNMDLLIPSDTVTFCAYKGRATYWSTADAEDVAWTYADPLREAAEITGMIAFFDERADFVVDGERLERPVTPWSR